MTLRLLLVVTMFLAGCASQQPLRSSDTYRRDSYECTRKAIFADIGTQGRVFNNCMKARGYEKA
ncbi:MAG TPA: hypothetical protein VEG60_10665 [Candidatus Binatia bacterium]|nr:hypothetical protein [Candidatus Binatia bacterium]